MVKNIPLSGKRLNNFTIIKCIGLCMVTKVERGRCECIKELVLCVKNRLLFHQQLVLAGVEIVTHG